jgi:hypothetical protein
MLALRLLRPLLVGLAAGAVFLVATLVLRLGVHNGIDPATRAQDAFILGFFSWNLALAVLVQAAAGAVARRAGAWTRSRSTPAPARGMSRGFVWDVFRRLVELGTLAALATSLLTLGVVSLVRRSVAHDELRPAASS